MDDKNIPQVDYQDYLQTKYQLTYELKTLTQNVNSFIQSVDKKFECYNKELSEFKKVFYQHPAKKATQEAIASSLSSNTKWLLVVILGVAFLGALGAAIGVNLLGYLGPLKP